MIFENPQEDEECSEYGHQWRFVRYGPEGEELWRCKCGKEILE
jgi:hypothetical protein